MKSSYESGARSKCAVDVAMVQSSGNALTFSIVFPTVFGAIAIGNT